MLLLTFSWKNFFIFIFFIVFLNNARKCCTPLMEIFFPHDKFFNGKFPPHNPLFSTPPPNQKIPLKTSVHFPITITICKEWSKFVTCSPAHGDCGGVNRPQRHSCKAFWLFWIKWLSQNFDSTTLEKNERGREPRCPPIFFCHLKRALEFFISVRMSPLAEF